MNTVKSFAAAYNFALPDDAAVFLAAHLPPSEREINGAVLRVGAWSLLSGQPITIEFVKALLGDASFFDRDSLLR